ncbi:MAG: hypothetical protein HGA27_05240 [Peptococcaceae bacterium]|nr:hypothetical protein [Peptococcaceae bacterium]
MKFDFKEAYVRISASVSEESNRRLNELKESGNNNFGDILNVMINSSIITTAQVLEEYHETLMKHLSEKNQ